jgi:hypothetical protein
MLALQLGFLCLAHGARAQEAVDVPTAAGSDTSAADTAAAAVPAAAVPAAAVPAPAGELHPVSWWLQLRSTGYLFQQQELADVELDRFGAYQEFDGAVSGLSKGRIAFRASGRVADDLYLAQRETDLWRLFTAYLDAKPGRRVTARLGRQFIQEGATGRAMDGLLVGVGASRAWDAKAWAGAAVAPNSPFEVASFDDAALLGARVGFHPLARLQVSTSLWYREREGRVAARPAGVEASYTPLPGIDLRGRAAYDLERELWSRAEAVGRWRHAPGYPVVTAQIIDRSPDIDAVSYFARFGNAKRARVARSTVRYERPNGLGGEVEYLGAFVEERTSTRVGVALLVPVGRVGYSARIGDAGEESRWYGDAAWDALEWLRLEGSVSFSTYALLEDAPESEEHDLVAAVGRLRATPRPGLGVTMEVQSLDNPVASEDVRFLAGIDLTMGRGTSRIGLDRGPWLQ